MDCFYFLKKSWGDQVTTSTVQNCFRKAGFVQDTLEIATVGTEAQTENNENEELEDDNLKVMAPMIVQLQEDTVENELEDFIVESPADENFFL